MHDVFDYAKYYIKQGLDTPRNTFDGNMKIQKLLVLANLISLAVRGVELYKEEILAFQQGCVIEPVRLRYKNDYDNLLNESIYFNPNFTQDIINILELNSSLFGKLSARELSDVNHSFDFWKDAYNNSIQQNGYKNKTKAIITLASITKELDKIKNIISEYNISLAENRSIEYINGIEFRYSPDDIILTDDLIDELFEFSLSADERSYNIYFDEGELVIY